MKTVKILILVALMSISVLITACGGELNFENGLIMHLKFDEKSGNKVSNSVKKGSAETVKYALSSGLNQAPIDPQWKENGVKGGCLQFDGYSNYIEYDYRDMPIGGDALTIDMWVAPRVYESNETGYQDKNNEHLTALVSQRSYDENSGILLGMHRSGSWSFQVGFGDRVVKVWDYNRPIEKYKWNKITAVFDGKNGFLKLYKNGILVGQENFFKGGSMEEALEIPLLIGKNNYSITTGPYSRQMFSGLMDECKIYNKALSDNEIKSKFESDLSNGTIKEVDFEDIWFDQSLLVHDKTKPTYHISAPQHWMNEAHAPIYYNGKYHLFYQFSPFGPYLMQPHWGHWVSDDMVNWKNVKEAISPAEGTVAPDGAWSGSAAYKSDGTPVILFTTSDLSRKYASVSDQNVGLATPLNTNDPLLLDWKVYDKLAIAQQAGQGRGCAFRDTHVWKEGDTWYLIIGAGVAHGGGSALLYTTKDDSFINWTYRGEIMDNTERYKDLFGSIWELPVLLPIKYTDGSESGKYVMFISPCPPASNDIVYFIGTFNKSTNKFIPDPGYEMPKLIDYGQNMMTGPNGFVDPVSGAVVMFPVTQDLCKQDDTFQKGWAHNCALPREFSLDRNNNLVMNPVRTIKNNFGNEIFSMQNASVDSVNSAIRSNNIGGDTLRIKIKAKRNTPSSALAVRVRQSADGMNFTQILWDDDKIATNTGLTGDKQFERQEYAGKLTYNTDIMEIEIFLDRSMLECFFNSEHSITSRIFPNDNSFGIELLEMGDIDILDISVIQMISIYDELR